MKSTLKVFPLNLSSWLVVVLLSISACTSSITPTIPAQSQGTQIPTKLTSTIIPLQTPELVQRITATLITVAHLESVDSLKILFIGNSYTIYNNLPELVEKLMLSNGYAVEVGQSISGGWSLSNHVSAPETLEKIAADDWTYVILQEQSSTTNVENGMYPAIRTLDQRIKAVGAETILFMTWAHRDGLPAAGYPDYSLMQAQVIANYLAIGEELGVRVAPVGLAWREALNRNPELALWDPDGGHPSKLGSYLAACVFYAILTGESPEGLVYIAGLSEENARFLQQIAAETVFAESSLVRSDQP